MDDRNAQVGWTDAQWNRVREEVLREWQRVRVAGSFLPVYGPLPPSTQVVPSEVVGDFGSVDDADTARILELTTPVELSRQQVQEEDLSGALLLFRRAAIALAREEDQVIFNGQLDFRGQVGPNVLGPTTRFPVPERKNGEPNDILMSAHDKIDGAVAAAQLPAARTARTARTPAQTLATAFTDVGFTTGLGNVGPLGLLVGAGYEIELASLNGDALVAAIVEAISQLEGNSYGPPFACVLGKDAFVAAHSPERRSLVLPADRIEPLLGRPLLRASAIDAALPLPLSSTPLGVVVSLAADAFDLVVAVDAMPVFTQVDAEGHYLFRVFERLGLRVKDNYAIVRLETHITEAAAVTAAHDTRRDAKERVRAKILAARAAPGHP